MWISRTLFKVKLVVLDRRNSGVPNFRGSSVLHLTNIKKFFTEESRCTNGSGIGKAKKNYSLLSRAHFSKHWFDHFFFLFFFPFFLCCDLGFFFFLFFFDISNIKYNNSY